jgi:MFS family permease
MLSMDDIPAALPAAMATRPAGNRALLPALLAVMAVQQIDRNIINVVLEPLKREFGLSDAQLGLLAGTIFASSYVIAGLPIGRLADRVNRRNLLAALLVVWSLLTSLSAFCFSYAMLVLVRTGVGAAESGTQPTAMSMLSDVYPAERRATVAGLIYGSAMFGGFLSFAVGGYVAANYGWRNAFLVAGLPGLLLAAFMMIAVKEPVRTAATPAAAVNVQGSFLRDICSLLFHPILGPIYLAGTICVLVVSAVSAWAISLLVRYNGLSLAEAGVIVALATSLSGTCGPPLAGWLTDRAGRRSAGNVLRIPAISATACGLGAWGFAHSFVPALSIACLCLMGLTSLAHAGGSISTISRFAPPQVRALGFALFSVAGSVLGLAIGPWLVGILSDASADPQPLRSAMAMVAPVNLVAVGLFLLGARRIDRRAPDLAPASLMAIPTKR